MEATGARQQGGLKCCGKGSMGRNDLVYILPATLSVWEKIMTYMYLTIECHCSLIYSIFYYFWSFCLYVCVCLCVYVYTLHNCSYPKKPEEGAESPVTIVLSLALSIILKLGNNAVRGKCLTPNLNILSTSSMPPVSDLFWWYFVVNPGLLVYWTNTPPNGLHPQLYDSGDPLYRGQWKIGAVPLISILPEAKVGGSLEPKHWSPTWQHCQNLS